MINFGYKCAVISIGDTGVEHSDTSIEQTGMYLIRVPFYTFFKLIYAVISIADTGVGQACKYLCEYFGCFMNTIALV